MRKLEFVVPIFHDGSEVVKRRKYKVGYQVFDLKVPMEDYGGEGFLNMKRAYTHDGYYIGRPKEAYFFYRKRGLVDLQPSINRLTYSPQEDNDRQRVVSIGFHPQEQKWYGWSHRAICGFQIGDKLFDEWWDKATDQTLFTQHGEQTITNLDEAKLAASRFAHSVS